MTSDLLLYPAMVLFLLTASELQMCIRDRFEFIPWILSQCASVKEARVHLAQMVLTDTPFNEQFAPAQLHWILADKNECIVIEPMADGLHIYDNPVGVLTNNPPFPQQLFSLNNYMNLSPKLSLIHIFWE